MVSAVRFCPSAPLTLLFTSDLQVHKTSLSSSVSCGVTLGYTLTAPAKSSAPPDSTQNLPSKLRRWSRSVSPARTPLDRPPVNSCGGVLEDHVVLRHFVQQDRDVSANRAHHRFRTTTRRFVPSVGTVLGIPTRLLRLIGEPPESLTHRPFFALPHIGLHFRRREWQCVMTYAEGHTDPRRHDRGTTSIGAGRAALGR